MLNLEINILIIKIKLLESKKIRSEWNDEEQKWYFSIVDVISTLTESDNPQVYWRVLKKRLLEEGNESVTNCNALKMEAADGRMRLIIRISGFLLPVRN